MKTIKVKSHKREELVEITEHVEKFVGSLGKSSAVCTVCTRHTTCGLTINENADPDVQSDMLGFLSKLIPQHNPDFKHAEQNSDAHIKSSLVGSSVAVPFDEGRLLLGRWQGVYLCEFDGPREREVVMVCHGE
jgi:secondary thiamine-phosphate synthase enzyme